MRTISLCPSGQETASKPQNKTEVRRQYLLEKYSWKWKQFMRAKSEGLFPRLLKLSHNNWLRQVASCTSTRAESAHCTQAACCMQAPGSLAVVFPASPRCCSPQPLRQPDRQRAPSWKPSPPSPAASSRCWTCSPGKRHGNIIDVC